ncbi:MAG: VCBS repeat-containing protein [bacterium]|nr:VCBS repeat-containing protein [bacterium]
MHFIKHEHSLGIFFTIAFVLFLVFWGDQNSVGFNIPIPSPGTGGSGEAIKPGEQWPYTYIEDSASSKVKGADGISLRVGGDGTMYTATSWQDSGGTIRLCMLTPGKRVYDNWSCVTVGKNSSAEFALLAQILGNGTFGVISGGKGGIKMHVIQKKEDYLNPSLWKTYTISVSVAKDMVQEWNDTVWFDVDKDGHPDIIAGGDKGIFGWFKSPKNPLNVNAWVFYPMVNKNNMRWEMGIHRRDMDGDGDIDFVVSDRGSHTYAGVSWFENPGVGGKQRGYWQRHDILRRKEVRMISLRDVNRDGKQDILVAATSPAEAIILLRQDNKGNSWKAVKIPVGKYGGYPKDVDAVDLDKDGRIDIVVTTVDLQDKGKGIYYLSQKDPDIYTSEWEFHQINPIGAKGDNITLRDFDSDGDLDLATSIEIPNLGNLIFWNPKIKK